MVVESTIRQGSFKAIFDIINDNQLEGWKVLSSFPEINPTFPCVVIRPSNISVNKNTINGAGRINELVFQIELYDTARNGKESIDKGQDNIQKTLNDNASTLQSSDNLLFQEVEDGDSDTFEFEGQKINYGIISARFKLA